MSEEGFISSRFKVNSVVHNAQPEPLDDRVQLTAPREWIVLACLVLALAALVIWGVFGNVERTLRADGVLVFTGERRAILSVVPGVVTEVLAMKGDRVTAGQAILRIAPARPPADLPAVSAHTLVNEAANATSASRAEVNRLLASTRALLDSLGSLRDPVETPSPGDGIVAAVLAAPGDSVASGAPVAELVSGDGDRLDAVAFVSRKESWRLSVGMAARVGVETSEGRKFLPGVLTAVARQTNDPPFWLARIRPDIATRGQGHFLRLAISDPLVRRSPEGNGRGLEEGVPCRIEIVLERTSPFDLVIRR